MSGQNFGFGGFKLKSSSQSKSSSIEKARLQSAYPLQVAAVARPSYGASFSRKHATEEDYFENNEGEELKNNNSKTCEYQPASDSSAEEQDDDEEDDPLDSFMAGIEVTQNMIPKNSI